MTDESPRRVSAALGFVAILIYAPGLFWGLPEGIDPGRLIPWGHDSIAPLGPLAESVNTFVTRDPNPMFLGYPLFHHFLVTVFYLPYLGILWFTGGFSSPTDQFPFGLADPSSSLAVLTVIARSVSLVMAAGTVVVFYLIGRRLWDSRTAVLFGVFVLLLAPMFYYSTTANLDIPYLFWGSLALLAYADVLKGGLSVRNGVALGAFAALATATKDQAAAMFLLMPVLILPLHFYRQHRADSGRAMWTPIFGTVLSGAVVYAFASGLVFGPARYFNHVKHILGIGEKPIYLPGLPPTLDGYRQLAVDFVSTEAVSLGWPMLLTALTGLVIAARRDRITLAFALPALSVLVTFIIPVRFVEARYILPISLVLAGFAAFAVGTGLNSSAPSVRRISAAATALILAMGAATGLNIVYGKLTDSRYGAAEWIDENSAPGDRIGFFGPDQKLPRIGAAYEYTRVVPFTGSRPVSYDDEDIDLMTRSVLESNARHILIIPDHTLLPGLPYGNTAPLPLLERLRSGTFGYAPATRIRSTRLLPWFPFPQFVKYDLVNPEVEILTRVDAVPPGPTGRP